MRRAWLGAILGMTSVPGGLHAYCIGNDKSWPGYSPDYYSVAREYRRSDFVVQAHVLNEIWIGEDGKPKPLRPPFQNGARRPWGFDPYLGAFYTVRIDKVFRGKPPATLRLFSENSTARFLLTPGSDIVAFVSPEKFDAPIGRQWTLDTCGNLALLSGGRAVIRQINAARRKSP